MQEICTPECAAKSEPLDSRSKGEKSGSGGAYKTRHASNKKTRST